jgi:hypothetical protein
MVLLSRPCCSNPVVVHLLVTGCDSVQDLIIPIRKSLISKGNCNLLERMIGCLDIVEVRQTCGEETKARNDQVKVSANASECIGRNHTNNKVKDPITRTFCHISK